MRRFQYHTSLTLPVLRDRFWRDPDRRPGYSRRHTGQLAPGVGRSTAGECPMERHDRIQYWVWKGRRQQGGYLTSSQSREVT